MSFFGKLAGTFIQHVAAGAGQMTGIAVGVAGVKIVGQAIDSAVEKVKECKDAQQMKRVTYTTVKQVQ